MQPKVILLGLLFGANLFYACQDQEVKTNALPITQIPFESQQKLADSIGMDRFCYAFGLLVGTNLKALGLQAKDVHKEELIRGLKAALGDSKADIDLSTAQSLITEVIAKIEQNTKIENLDAGKKFLAAIATRKGIKKKKSGLLYEVLQKGSGAKPNLQDKVKVHYHATLIDGTIFDSSVDRGEPSTFELSAVIKGWQEGLQLMSVGAKYKFYIPAKLGYGDKLAGKIPANSTLIFEIELLGLE